MHPWDSSKRKGSPITPLTTIKISHSDALWIWCCYVHLNWRCQEGWVKQRPRRVGLAHCYVLSWRWIWGWLWIRCCYEHMNWRCSTRWCKPNAWRRLLCRLSCLFWSFVVHLRWIGSWLYNITSNPPQMHNKASKWTETFYTSALFTALDFGQPTYKFLTTVHVNATHPPLKLPKRAWQCAHSTVQTEANLQMHNKAYKTLCTSALFVALSFTQTSSVKLRENSISEAITNFGSPTICTGKSSKRDSKGTHQQPYPRSQHTSRASNANPVRPDHRQELPL